MLSLAGSHALRQLSSPGKSGCMFFLSDDQKLLVKTMRKDEIHTLIGMLPKVGGWVGVGTSRGCLQEEQTNDFQADGHVLISC